MVRRKDIESSICIGGKSWALLRSLKFTHCFPVVSVLFGAPMNAGVGLL